MSKSALPAFFQEVYSIWPYIQVFNPFCVSYQRVFIFILLHVAFHFSQHHLLKRLIFLSLYALASFVIDQLTIGAWVYFWAFYTASFCFFFFFFFLPVPYCFNNCNFPVLSEVRKLDSSVFVFVFQYCFGYSGSLVFLYNF